MEGWAHNRFILEQDTRKACSLRSFCFVALLDIHTEEAGRVRGAPPQLDEGCHTLLFRDSVIHFRRLFLYRISVREQQVHIIIISRNTIASTISINIIKSVPVSLCRYAVCTLAHID